MARLPRGITRTPTGWRISLGAHGVLRKRFPASTTLEDVIAERDKLARTRTAGKLTAAAGTLAADVQRYLTDYYQGRAGYAERARHLALWVTALGADTRRSDLARDDIARVLHGWRAAGLAADTCNKRRTALLALYHALDGKGGSNPVREIPKFRAPDPLPRGLAYPDIEQALKQLPPCKTKARLAVMAYTGLRPGQVMKLQPSDWDDRRHTLTVSGTAKGRGTKPYVIPLSRQATAALDAFDGLEAWGVFTWAPMGRLWRQAWYAMSTKQKRTPTLGVPKDFPAPVPYDLRHSFGTAAYRATGDIKAVQKLLGHSSLRMTDRYTLAAVPERQQRAVAAFEKAVTPTKKRSKPTSAKGRKCPPRNAHQRHLRNKSR